MQYREKLHWTVIKRNTSLKTADQDIAESIAFVRGLGMKCDSVGWTEMDASDPRTEEILQEIKKLCSTGRWISRGFYEREYALQDAQWFELAGRQLQDDSVGDFEFTKTQNGEELKLWTIRAYRELSVEPKTYYGRTVIVPERFKDVCRAENIEGLDFCWVRDTGRYAGHQYYHIFGTQLIQRIGVPWDIKKDREVCLAAGGWLPRVAEVIDELYQINMPNCYLEGDLPDSGIAYAYIPRDRDCVGAEAVLIHKDAAQRLLLEKAIRPDSLIPALVCKELPGGYTMRSTSASPRPTKAYRDCMEQEKDRLLAINRPVRMVSQKDALKLLRKAKKENGAAFGKKLSQPDMTMMHDSAYAPLLPYYAVSDGGCLSDEYTLLAFKSAVAEQVQLQGELRDEETLEEKQAGIVIGSCANGDRLLLLTDGQVARFSHEVLQTTDQWPSLPMFLAEALGG